MRRYLAGRLLQALGVVVFVTTLTFVLIHLAPGDPIGQALQGPNVTEAVRNEWRAAYGLDRPLPEQYLRWVASAARGQFGYSFSQHRPVRDVLAESLPRTLLLSSIAILFSFGLGIGVGLLQAERPRGARDRWLGRVLLLLYSVPDFWLALMVLILFAYRLPLFPAGGLHDSVTYAYMSPTGQLLDRIKHLVLPVLTLTMLSTASIARYQRSALVAVLRTDWMRTALAKGLSWRQAVRQHAFRNALLPTITLFSLTVPTFAAGAIFVEMVFSWPGMGFNTVHAIAARDYPLVTSGVLVSSVIVVITALLADIAVAAADPRVRLS
ncbi:MAG: binding-protein-dependent transport system inner rane component [Gemmatimonadetes bacterium]|nr:binding-protein-dependent transport system inner rane component [Gemmatimonadota bacterium]